LEVKQPLVLRQIQNIDSIRAVQSKQMLSQAGNALNINT